jgi:hypothetical protein
MPVNFLSIYIIFVSHKAKISGLRIIWVELNWLAGIDFMQANRGWLVIKVVG